MVYPASSYSLLPSKSGVYRFLDKQNSVLYVGKANNLKLRVSSYFREQASQGLKTKNLVSQIHKIKITIVNSEIEALLLEAFYIKKYLPKYNIRLVDNKSYPQIEIEIKDKYPGIFLTRRENDPQALYYGPFPSASSVKLVLKTIRRVFPFISVKNHPPSICFYNHLGLCPCPQVFNNKESIKDYRKNIKGIKRILEGQSQKLMLELKKERDQLSLKEDFEQASKLQKKINALELITTQVHTPSEYDVNPNLTEDLREAEISELIGIFNKNGLKIESLNKIECYDISNTQGLNPTASLVVMKRGEIDKSQYRKFKIRGKGPNDFAMLKEVLDRRLKHTEWTYPDLIIIDGGKGQVSSVIKILSLKKINIPVIGLAKKQETIVIPSSNVLDLDFKEIVLPKNNIGLHLIMRIRDEAHRFALGYHRKLRSISSIFNN